MGAVGTASEEVKKDDFEGAFAEAAGEGQKAEAQADSGEKSGQAAVGDDKPKTSEGEGTGEEDGKAAGAEGDKGSGDQAKSEKGGDGKGESEDDLEYDISKLTPEEMAEKLRLERQRRKSYDGVVRSKSEKLKQTEEELERLKAGSQASTEAKDKGSAEGETDKGEKKPDKASEIDYLDDFKKDPKVEEFLKEYDEVGPMMLEMGNVVMKKAAAMVLKAAETIFQHVGPVVKSAEEQAQERHFAAIKEKHPDYDGYIEKGEIKDWIAELPAYKKEAYQKVYDRGTTQDMIDMVTEFRNAKGYAGGTEKKNGDAPVDEKKINGLEAVKSRKGPISTSGKSKDPNDFSSAFSEAARS